MQSVSSSAVVGRSIVIRGELTGEEDLTIDGTIEGSIKLPGGRLTIGVNAQVKANLEAQEIIVLGAVQGNLHAVDRVELRKTARLLGDVVAARLSIEEGSTVQGRADLTGATAASRAVSAPRSA